MSSKLVLALKSVDWNGNISELCANDPVASRIEACNMKLALWSRQLEMIEAGNPALSFVREMQHGGHNVACTLALALYKPAASAMRSLVECALYYTYFRSHQAELATLVRDDKYYVSKKEIVQFFSRHVPDFSARQSVLGYLERLERWYSLTSSIVHGQIPGQWSNGKAVSDIKHDLAVLEQGVVHFEEAVYLVQSTFICVLGENIWGMVESDAKGAFCKGMSGDQKTRLKLDTA